MSTEQEMDAATLARYRRVLDEAADTLWTAHPDESRRVEGATSALFAALARRDERERAMAEREAAMLAVVRAVATDAQHSPDAYAEMGLSICGGCGTVYHNHAEVHMADCAVLLARQLVPQEGGE